MIITLQYLPIAVDGTNQNIYTAILVTIWDHATAKNNLKLASFSTVPAFRWDCQPSPKTGWSLNLLIQKSDEQTYGTPTKLT